MAFQLSRRARRLLRDPESLRFVLRGLGALTPDAAAFERALIHLQLSVDVPRPDAVHLEVRHHGRLVPFREALATTPTGQLSGRVERLEREPEGDFDFEPTEAFERVVRHYRVDWSNFMPYAPSVRAHFITDPREVQEDFLHAFLELYDEGTDVTAQPGADAAAEWLRARRRCTARFVVTLAEVPRAPRPLPELEAELRSEWGRLQSATAPLPLEAAWISRVVRDAAVPPVEGLHELLTELKVPPPLRALQVLTSATGELLRSTSLEYAGAPPEVHEAWAALRRAFDACLADAW